MSRRPLRIGISARLLHKPPTELGFRGKTLQYLEQSVAHWLQSHGAVAVMIPTLGYDAEVARSKISVREYADMLDGLVLQGGADVSPQTYSQQPLRPEWSGDAKRDRYEIELIEGFVHQGRPVLGICRGCQLINVWLGGSLVQDLALQRPETIAHVDAALYDELEHGLRLVPGTRLAEIYAEQIAGNLPPRVNSIHHQAVDRLGADLKVEAFSALDGVVEAIRSTGAVAVSGVQWHPEFQLGRADRLDPEPLMKDFLRTVRESLAE
ncbi:MAG TPA: gamma-glutamyl-gamma-aminobutyrate hydrolase family protein [Burkholderiaceae bacterium]